MIEYFTVFRSEVRLTELQFEVLRLTAAGLTLDEISLRMYRSKSSVRGYRFQVLEQLGATNICHAIHIAWQIGLLP